MGRTGELARATLDAADDVFILATFPVLHLREFSKEIGFQPHRTHTDTFRTTDARLGLFATGLVVGDDRHRVGSFADRYLDGCQSLTHHRTTSQQFVVTLRHTTTSIDEILHRGTHTNEEVTRMGQTLARDSGVTLEERLTLHHCLINSESCTNILHDSTDIHRDSRGSRHLTLYDGIDELFLTTLRIALL